ncbi:MAG: site-2 protease family protein [Chloroflexota bacterium]|nr:site-2 protease family protein [Chloroflexota bacterium]
MFRVARIGGVDIKVHWSWALVVLLVTFQLGSLYFPDRMPGESEVTYMVLGFVASLLLFLSVLLHELSHSFVAKARGLKVRDIVLYIFGGVSNIEQEPEKASDEFLIAVVGPLTSLGISLLCVGLAHLVSPPVHKAGAGAAATLEYMAGINFLLGLFNLIPGFPLDGGRVLRSIIWGATHNFRTATRIAGFAGQLVGYGFIFWGLYEELSLGDAGGLWLAFIGWFLLNAAQSSVSGVGVRDALRGVTVAQVMEPAPVAGAPHMTLAHILTQFVLPYNLTSLPIVQEGRLVGIAALSDIQHIEQDQWGTVTAGDVMTRLEGVQMLQPLQSLQQAMAVLGSGSVEQVPVVSPNGALVGMLTRAHLLAWLHAHGVKGY